MARYHRKSAPRPSHSGVKALGRADQHKVRLLAGLLRVGIALDRTYRRAVECVHVRLTGNTVTIDVEAAVGRAVEIELLSAEARASLLATTLGRPLEFRVVTPCGVPGGITQAHRGHPSAGSSVRPAADRDPEA